MFKPLAEVLPSSSVPTLSANCAKLAAKVSAFAVLSSYRNSDVDDPEGFVANAVAVLTNYPEAVVQEVCRPGTGIQTKIKWPPTQQEFRQECERVATEHANRERRRQLTEHRVLIDTRHGPMPEPEFSRLPEAERERIVAGFDGLQADLKPARKRAPPNMDLLQPRPVAPLSALAKHALGIKPQEATE
jgi:hypothetical protein